MNEEELDELITNHLRAEKPERSNHNLITKLCECFQQQCQRLSEQDCMNVLKLLVSILFVLKQFRLEYRTVRAARRRQRYESKKTLFSSGLKQNSLVLRYGFIIGIPFELQERF